MNYKRKTKNKSKGLAISSILYTLLILFLALLFGILGLITSSKLIYDSYKNNLGNRLNGIEEPTIRTLSMKAGSNSIMVVVSALSSGNKIENYYYSIDGENYIRTNEPTYVFNNLEVNSNYTVYVKVEGKTGLQSKEVSKAITTKTIENPVISQVSYVPSEGYTYAIKRVLKIDYTTVNVENPMYYFKSSVDATISSGTVVESCGNGIQPIECSSSNDTTLVSNTWYRTQSNSVNITYNKTGKLYALVGDGANISGTSTYTINKIDSINPTVFVSTDRNVVTFTMSDDIGVIGYGVNQSSTTAPTYTPFESITSTTKTWTASTAGTYYVWVQDNAGRTAKVSFEIKSSAFIYNADEVSYTNAKYPDFSNVKDALDYLYEVLK